MEVKNFQTLLVLLVASILAGLVYALIEPSLG